MIGEVSGRGGVTVKRVTRTGSITASKAAAGVSAYHDGGSLGVEDSWFDSDVTGGEEVGGAIGYFPSGAQGEGATLSNVALLGDVDSSAAGNTSVGCYVGDPNDETTNGLTLSNGTMAYGSVVGSAAPRTCPGNGQTPPEKPVRWVPPSLQPPGAPSGVVVSGVDGTASVSWTAATVVAGGQAITSYTVTASPGGASCTVAAPATTCDVAGLTVGTSYTFSVTATNEVGTGPAAASSAFVMTASPAVTTVPAVTPVLPETGRSVPVLPAVSLFGVGLLLTIAARRRTVWSTPD
jgi:hypothetical protein